MADRLIDIVLNSGLEERALFYSSLTEKEMAAFNAILASEIENPWARYEHDPVGFIEQGLKATLWSKQKEILQSLMDNKRTVVPACHAPGKSWLASHAIAWWMSVHPPGTAIAISTAPTFRQVRNIMWAGIRRIHLANDLPGEILTNQWKMDGTVVAYGFSPRGDDESAVQGIHAPHLLIVVDEAGGFSDTVGKSLEALMTGGHTRLLALGNPPTDTEETWFERICSSPLYNIITIPAKSTPNFTGEPTGLCKSCPPFVEPHEVATHLVDQTWVDDVISEFGEDSPFVEARVNAVFPKSSVGKVIPFSWCEQAVDNDDPVDSEVIRYGVDIASDGGDEFVIAKADGYVITIEHRSSGKANSSAVDVAGVIWEHALRGVAIHQERKVKDKIRVKIDAIGVGWGVVSILKAWVTERKMGTKIEIIGINVAERPANPEKFKNQRAEMWWNARTLLQPLEGRQDLQLKVERPVLAQLAGPTYKSDSAGRIVIESKIDMKKRGVHSPDRAEAILLAVYEPKPIIRGIAPISVEQSNPWAMNSD